MTQVCNMISRCLIIGLEFPTKVTAVRKGSPFAQLIETVRWTLLIQAKLFFFLNFSYRIQSKVYKILTKLSQPANTKLQIAFLENWEDLSS